MAASTGAELVARVKKFREVESLQHENIQNVPELLEKISKFLQDHETSITNDCTHTVFDNYSDWWMNNKPTYKLSVAEDNTVDQLHRMVAQLYDLGIPLTLTEKRTQVIRFIQEVEIWGTQDDCVSASELVDCQGAFMKLLGKIMGEIYPGQPNNFLDCVIFDSTGLSRTKGIMKTSVRLVWSSIVVDRTRAGKIYDYVVFKFKDSQDPDIKALEERFLKLNSKDNQWNNVFSDSVYFSRLGVRMPLCDRVSPAPLKKPEKRPFKPLGVIRCNYSITENGNEFQFAERFPSDALTREEWIKIGCVRLDAGVEQTEWQAPNFVPPTASRNRTGGTGGGVNDRDYVRAEPGARQPGAVRRRTMGGSDRPSRPQTRSHQQTQQETLVTVQREFEGSLAGFREHLEKAGLIKDKENITEDAERLVWRQPGDTGRIEMKASNHRVYLTGKAHQVRSLCRTVTPFCRPADDAASYIAGTARRSRPGSRAGSRPGVEFEGNPSDVYAPNRTAGYAPSAVYAPSNRSVHSNTSLASTNRANMQLPAERRLAHREFVQEGQGELELQVGDHLTIVHDPDATIANVDRWVHGSNDRTKEKGWFPHSYTRPLQSIEDTAQA